MDNNKNLTLENIFNLALKNQQEKKFDVAQDLYNQVLKIDPNFIAAHINLGVLFNGLSDVQKAKNVLKK